MRADEYLSDVVLDPSLGNVGFGSGYFAWGFTLLDFANLYCPQHGTDPAKIAKKLWGNWCWHPERFKWVKHDPLIGPYTKNGDNIVLERGFVQFIYNPLLRLHNAIAEQDFTSLNDICLAFGLPEIAPSPDLTPKQLYRHVLHGWLPCSATLIHLISNLPNPCQAQMYRISRIYSGPLDSPLGQSLVNCDPNGEVMIYISKMVPQEQRMVAFGRVFSGTIIPGKKVNVFAAGYKFGESHDLNSGRVSRTLCMLVGRGSAVDQVPAGNLVGLDGIDKFILKTATISTDREAHPFVDMKFTVAPVVKYAIDVPTQHLNKLNNSLKTLVKSDPLLVVATSSAGERTIGVSGVLHGETVLKKLQRLMGSVKVQTKQPIVSYCEGVTRGTGGQGFPDIVLAKSPNNHNRLYCTAQPLAPSVVKALQNDDINSTMSVKALQKTLQALDFDPEVNAKKIWCFGGEPEAKANVFVDKTAGVNYLNEIKPHVVAMFQQITFTGVLCEEPLLGCQFNLVDCTLHPDSVHRGAGAIMPATRRIVKGAQLASGPCLYEPIYLVEITVASSMQQRALDTIFQRRGQLLEIRTDSSGTTSVIEAHLPVAQSFDFDAALRGATGGEAFQQCAFSHYAEVQGNPLEEGSEAFNIMMDIRRRKGLKEEIPIISDYNDRL